MNKQEIFNGLLIITKEKHNACKTDAASVDKNHPTERRALQLKAGIYNVAIAAGLISGIDQATELMSKRFKNLIKLFPISLTIITRCLTIKRNSWKFHSTPKCL